MKNAATNFNWPLFLCALGLMAAPVVATVWQALKDAGAKRGKPQPQQTSMPAPPEKFTADNFRWPFRTDSAMYNKVAGLK